LSLLRSFNSLTISIRTDRDGPKSALMRLTERFARMADNKLNYSFMHGYPSLYAQPWTARSPMYRGDNLYKYACHEGNYLVRAILAGARTLEKGPSAPGQ
ncbi:MAG: hypothetical protein VXX10_02810, partial [Pseudomonadota bacterium]|nr:hypothetical protein [Pseudomonadota bacterium]